jgi:hypothetical protein
MSYVRKVIGQDEKLIGIARLHWIYIVQGILWFVACVAIARLTGSVFNHFLAIIPATSSLGLPILALQTWLTPFALFFGAIICSLYVVKVLTTEIGLTNRRIIYKRGWLFVNVKEIDIEEIRGENLNTGYLGRFLNYGYINLDCRFIGDVQLPAIENPHVFLKALHKMRTEVTDTVSLVVGDKTIAMVEDNTSKAPGLNHETPALQKDEHLDQTEVIAKAVAEAMQRMPAAATAPAQPAAPATVDPVMVAAIVEQVVPTMVERVAEKVTEKVTEKVSEEIEAKGILPIPPGAEILDEDTTAPTPHPMADESRLELEGPDEELLQSFDEAATAIANENKPHPDEPKQVIR